MTWKEARLVAARHCAALQIPRDMTGVTCPITDYDDEDTLRFLKTEEPDITLVGQRMLNQAFARELRRRGATVVFVRLNVSDYFGWLGQNKLDDSPARRAQFICDPKNERAKK